VTPEIQFDFLSKKHTKNAFRMLFFIIFVLCLKVHIVNIITQEKRKKSINITF